MLEHFFGIDKDQDTLEYRNAVELCRLFPQPVKPKITSDHRKPECEGEYVPT
jgi:hypothetical protein